MAAFLAQVCHEKFGRYTLEVDSLFGRTSPLSRESKD